MKFVIAPDKYKGSLSGKQFCEAVSKGLLRVFANAVIVHKPLADGGDGTIEVVKDYLGAVTVSTLVKDPLFNLIKAPYLYSVSKKTAFIEMSEASGYKLVVGNKTNCRHTTTLGTGELIVDALDRGADTIVLGIGGSATNDGGMGIAVALGYDFLDENGMALAPIGENLIKVKKIGRSRLHPRLEHANFKVACDVNNPFHGPNGAAHVYAPQKGASENDVAFLDEGLRHFAAIIHEEFNVEVQDIPGSGAAGGVGGGAIVFLNAQLNSGIDLIKDIASFDKAIEQANWIITGEGKLDNQTFSGKTISGVVASAKRFNVPVAAFCGVVELTIDEQEQIGITHAASILKNLGDLEKAKKDAYSNLEFMAFNFASILKRDITLV
ncbi:glycerate kinase [uncultured Croceitalea sp.]|uniref:glycerate kinase n=1 Tax=uncultured Croceitalea sp. TaxID=1798908 RepID=UPI003305F333